MIRFEQGNKHPLDKKVFWNDIQVKMDDIGRIVCQLCKNEDNIYPKPRFRGGQMLIDFLQEVYNKGDVTDELLKKYKLGDYRP